VLVVILCASTIRRRGARTWVDGAARGGARLRTTSLGRGTGQRRPASRSVEEWHSKAPPLSVARFGSLRRSRPRPHRQRKPRTARDPSTVFTGSGMQPLTRICSARPIPLGIASSTRNRAFALRISTRSATQGTPLSRDARQLEAGLVFKDEQLPWLFSFLAETLRLDPERLVVTVFAGRLDGAFLRTTSPRTSGRSLQPSGVSNRFASSGRRSGQQRSASANARIALYDESNCCEPVRSRPSGDARSVEPGDAIRGLLPASDEVEHDHVR